MNVWQRLCEVDGEGAGHPELSGWTGDELRALLYGLQAVLPICIYELNLRTAELNKQ